MDLLIGKVSGVKRSFEALHLGQKIFRTLVLDGILRLSVLYFQPLVIFFRQKTTLTKPGDSFG